MLLPGVRADFQEGLKEPFREGRRIKKKKNLAVSEKRRTFALHLAIQLIARVDGCSVSCNIIN
ncbi:hypothetical protein LPYR103PRE_04200 [Segatella asaccharophila]|jgi:hypothetical protein